MYLLVWSLLPSFIMATIQCKADPSVGQIIISATITTCLLHHLFITLVQEKTDFLLDFAPCVLTCSISVVNIHLLRRQGVKQLHEYVFNTVGHCRAYGRSENGRCSQSIDDRLC